MPRMVIGFTGGYTSAMNLNHLQHFLAVAENGSVRAAAEALGLSQPAVSKSVRTLETAARAAQPGELVAAFTGPTDLFILPGYTFRVVDAMITNFHLPRSTLIMLVSAFAGEKPF